MDVLNIHKSNFIPLTHQVTSNNHSQNILNQESIIAKRRTLKQEFMGNTNTDISATHSTIPNDASTDATSAEFVTLFELDKYF